MTGRRSRDKGARAERAIVRLLQEQGIVAEKISGMYKAGADLRVPLLAVDRAVEVKCRAAGFRQLYDWLNGRDALIVKADRREPLVVVRLSLAADFAKLERPLTQCSTKSRMPVWRKWREPASPHTLAW